MLSREMARLYRPVFVSADACSECAMWLMMIYRHTRNEGMLVESIRVQRQAVDLLPQIQCHAETFCANLAGYLTELQQHITHSNLLLEAIDIHRQALVLCPAAHAHHVMSLNRLGTSLQIWYLRTGSRESLAETIAIQRRIIAACSEGHSNRGLFCGNLASSLWLSFNYSGDANTLAEAVALDRESYALTPQGHPDRQAACEHLARSLWTAYEHDQAKAKEPVHRESCGGHSQEGQMVPPPIVDVEEALVDIIRCNREALSLYSKDEPSRHLCYRNLAITLGVQHARTGDANLLQEAIGAWREAVALLKNTGTSEYITSCRSLARLLRGDYHMTSDKDLLAEVIDLEREVLTTYPKGDPSQIQSCRDLGDTLRIQYQHSGKASLLEEAIELHREATTLCPTGHPNRRLCCTCLAKSLTCLYEQTNDENLLLEIIDLEREALSLYPEGDLHKATSCVVLANAMQMRFHRTGESAMLDEAIELLRKSLTIRPEGHADRFESCANLSGALRLRFQRFGGNDFIKDSIDLQRQALALSMDKSPHRATLYGSLARSLWVYYQHTGDRALLPEIVELHTQSLALAFKHRKWQSATALCGLQLELSAVSESIAEAIRFLGQSLEHEPDDVFSAARSVLPTLHHLFWEPDLQESHHLMLIPIYQRAISLLSLLPLLVNPTLKLSSQLEHLSIHSHIGADAFINSVLANHWEPGLEALEMARGVTWAQRLHLRDPQLERVPKDLAAQLERHISATTGHQAHLSSAPDSHFLTSRDVMQNQSLQMYSLIHEIRGLPGLDRFMLGENCETLLTVASNHPVVVLADGRNHFYALIIHSNQARTKRSALLPLSLTKKDFMDSLARASSIQGHYRGIGEPEDIGSDISIDEARGARRQEVVLIHRYLKFVWMTIVQPVLKHLGLHASKGRERPRLHWCPTGGFTQIPLHAAGVHDGPVSQRICCADYVVSSYTPTLTNLLRAQQSAPRLAKADLALALVAERRAYDQHLPSIPGVEAETRAISATATVKHVKIVNQQASSTTIAGTTEAIKVANILHLACHGIQDSSDAALSGFCLGDGQLRILDLMELQIKDGFLAFLSACETAKGDLKRPDQIIHLAAAMLFAGFKSVIATMWAISDTDGPQVAEWFYEELFAGDVVDADAVAYAFDVAIRKLQSSGVPASRWAPFVHLGV